MRTYLARSSVQRADLTATPPFRPQVGAWSMSGLWLPIVDELRPLVTCSCGSTPKLAVTWVFGSQQFSSLHAIFGSCVPGVPCSICGLFAPKPTRDALDHHSYSG